MTTTAGDIINRAFRLLRIVDSDGTADTTQLANGLIALNGLVDSLNAEKLTLHQEVESTHTLTGATSYTIGSGGTFNTTRPERILSAYYRVSNEDYNPLRIVDKENWDLIQGKTDAGYPNDLWYSTAYPLGVIHLWPNPVSGTLVLTQTQQLTEFASTSTTVTLPAGYRNLLVYNLAVDYSPEGGVLTPEIERLAAKYLGMVKRRNNQKTPEVQLEVAFISGTTRTGNIFNGG